MHVSPVNRARKDPKSLARLTGRICFFVVEVESPSPDREDFARLTGRFLGTRFFRFFSRFSRDAFFSGFLAGFRPDIRRSGPRMNVQFHNLHWPFVPPTFVGRSFVGRSFLCSSQLSSIVRSSSISSNSDWRFNPDPLCRPVVRSPKSNYRRSLGVDNTKEANCRRSFILSFFPFFSFFSYFTFFFFVF